MMYTANDVRLAGVRLKKCALGLAAFVLLLLGVYALGVVEGAQWLMLVALIVCFAGTLFMADIWLVPRLQYWRFLRDMQRGLRRSAECILVGLDENIQLQDGVRVRILRVRLCGDDDSRLFYLNVSKHSFLPPLGSRVQLTSYGRHVVECTAI